jgi:hypothetical protein
MMIWVLSHPILFGQVEEHAVTIKWHELDDGWVLYSEEIESYDYTDGFPAQLKSSFSDYIKRAQFEGALYHEDLLSLETLSGYSVRIFEPDEGGEVIFRRIESKKYDVELAVFGSNVNTTSRRHKLSEHELTEIPPQSADILTGSITTRTRIQELHEKGKSEALKAVELLVNDNLSVEAIMRGGNARPAIDRIQAEYYYIKGLSFTSPVKSKPTALFISNPPVRKIIFKDFITSDGLKLAVTISGQDSKYFRSEIGKFENYLTEKINEKISVKDKFFISSARLNHIKKLILEDESKYAFKGFIYDTKARQLKVCIEFVDISSFDVILTLLASYAPEDGASIGSEIKTVNLIDAGDTLRLRGDLGYDILKGNLDWSIPFTNLTDKMDGNLSFGSSFTKRDNVLYGESNGTRFGIEELKGYINAELSYDSYTEADKFKFSNSVKSDLDDHLWANLSSKLDFGNVNISNTPNAVSAVEEGKICSGALSFNLGYRIYFDEEEDDENDGYRISDLTLRLSTDFTQGGGVDSNIDYFSRAHIGGAAELYFENELSRFSFIRGITSCSGSNDLPLQERILLGGNENVRGVEQGEFGGNSLSSFTVESGWSTIYLLKQVGLLKSEEQIISTGSESASPSQFIQILSSTYLKVFYDVGWVGSSGSYFNPYGDSEFAQGVGVALELTDIQIDPRKSQAIAFEVGYAYSPDSDEHEFGRFFVNARYDF